MAFTRKFLKALDIPDEKIEQIMDAHTEVTDSLKAERDEAKKSAESVENLTKERDDALAKVEELTKQGGDIAAIRKEYADYKAQVESEKTNAVKSDLIRKALEGKKANAQVMDLLMGQVDLSKVEVEDGKLKDEKSVLDPLMTKYSGLFGTDAQKGTAPNNPPSGGGSKMTKDEIMKISDRDARRKAIAENMELFE